MASTITIDAAAEGLNLYQDTYKTRIIQQMKNPLQLENLISNQVAVSGGVYVPPRMETTNVIQPYQDGFTPSSSATFKDKRIIAQEFKVDIEIKESQVMKFHKKWQTVWAGGGKDPMTWTFARFLWDTWLSHQIPHEMDYNSYHGVYAAPTAGTAGLSVAAVNGFKTTIAAAITAGDVGEIAVGALTPTTVMSKTRTFCQGLPETVRFAPGRILMSETNAQYHKENWRDTYGFAKGNENLEPQGEFVIDYGKRIQPVRAMNGSDRFIFLPDAKENLVVVRDSDFAQMPELYWKSDIGLLKGRAVITRAYDFEDPSELYVSDNA